MNNNISCIILGILTKILKCEVKQNDILLDLQIDSLDFMRIIIEIENKFNFEFDDNMLKYDRFYRVDDLIKYTIKKIGE